MNLKERYENASSAQYPKAYEARNKQNEPSEAEDSIVNFMDAGGRTSTTDSFQTEFRRNAPGTKKYVQSADTTEYKKQDEKKGLSRWYGRALNYAFKDPLAPNNYIQDSVWTSQKNIRPSTKDSWADNPLYFHRYTPTIKFETSTMLSELAQKRAASKSKRV